MATSWVCSRPWFKALLKLCGSFSSFKQGPPKLSFLIDSLKITYLVLDVPPGCVNQGLSSGARMDLWSNHLAMETPNASPSLTPEQ